MYTCVHCPHCTHAGLPSADSHGVRQLATAELDQGVSADVRELMLYIYIYTYIYHWLYLMWWQWQKAKKACNSHIEWTCKTYLSYVLAQISAFSISSHELSLSQIATNYFQA